MKKKGRRRKSIYNREANSLLSNLVIKFDNFKDMTNLLKK